MNCFWKRGTWPGIPFFTIPEALVTNGHLINLSHSALRLYLSILFTAQKLSATNVTPNYDASMLVGLKPISFPGAVKELVDAGLVKFRSDRSFDVLDPTTKLALPSHEGRDVRGNKLRNFRPMAQARQQANDRKALTLEQKPEESTVES